MIGFLRIAGLLTAAVWFGSAVFFTFVVAPAVFSTDMQQLLGERYYPYFSGAIAQIVIARFFGLQLFCGVVALLLVLMEWLYFGRPPRSKTSFVLVGGLLALVLLGGFWMQPKIKALHAIKYSTTATAESREVAAKSLRVWHGVAMTVNLGLLAGLAVHLARTARSPAVTRFVTSSKLQG